MVRLKTVSAIVFALDLACGGLLLSNGINRVLRTKLVGQLQIGGIQRDAQKHDRLSGYNHFRLQSIFQTLILWGRVTDELACF